MWEVVNNHVWASARATALKRDRNRCVICDETDDGEKAKAYRKRSLQWKSYLEVNHIRPVNGRRKSLDCQNHLDNLETLCHDCHVAVTKQQRKDGLIGGRKHQWRVLRLNGLILVQCKHCGACERSHGAAWKRDAKGEECRARKRKRVTKRLRRTRGRGKLLSC